MTTSTTGSPSHLGGVVAANRAAVADDPANGQVVFRASATAHDAVASTVGFGAYRVEVDEPPALGGDGKAPNPAEYYLASLLSCQIVTWRIWAEKLGIAVGVGAPRLQGGATGGQCDGTRDAGALPRTAGSGRRTLSDTGSDAKRHPGDDECGSRLATD